MIRKLYRAFSVFVTRTILVLRFVLNYRKHICKPSYYPEKEHKTRFRIFCDFISHIIRYGVLDISYFELGLDVCGNSYDNYLSYHQFMIRRDRLNMAGPYNYVCLLRNKSLFTTLCDAWNIPSVKDLAIIRNGVIYNAGNTSFVSILKEHCHLFIKPTDSKKGMDIHKLDYEAGKIFLNGEMCTEESVEKFINDITAQSDFIVQERLVQHPYISAIYSLSINTVRIVTVNNLKSFNSDDVYVLGGELRIGANGNFTDNISAGGVKVGIDIDGKLCRYGYFSSKYGTKTTVHPDTGTVFEGYYVPFYKEALDLCKRAHSLMKEIHLIGWDIAITEKGPVLIEGNDSCGTDFQVLFGPMKEVYNKYLPE